MMEGLGVFGVWLFLCVFLVVDTWVFLRGYGSFFHKHKTEKEKQLRDAIIERTKEGD